MFTEAQKNIIGLAFNIPITGGWRDNCWRGTPAGTVHRIVHSLWPGCQRLCCLFSDLTCQKKTIVQKIILLLPQTSACSKCPLARASLWPVTEQEPSLLCTIIHLGFKTKALVHYNKLGTFVSEDDKLLAYFTSVFLCCSQKRRWVTK